jgi:cell wall-associated NlpC family hydrolase
MALLITACSGPVRHEPLPQPIPKEMAKKLVSEANSHVGEPYKYGGTTTRGWDCSGFVRTMYLRALGASLPRTAREMYERCQAIPFVYRREGDLIFFQINSQKPSHVGILIKNNKFIHVSISEGVIVSSIEDGYYRKYLLGIKRLTPDIVASSR